ncbi:MAG: helix-turn-helix domain-containing protein [Actinomycetota bacterium]|nr:helix-turn-helix domain-containing protein [Actinomycetota bacterium]
MADWLKLPEVARRIGVSEKTARRYVKSGALPSVFVGGAYRVTEEALEGFLRDAKVTPGGDPPKVRQPSLEDVRAFLEARLGHSLIAAPEEEWSRWWRDVSKGEAAERFARIGQEWTLLWREWLATLGKTEDEPRLVPRGRTWGGVFLQLWRRHFAAGFYAPQDSEPEEDFLARGAEGLAVDAFYAGPVQKQREQEERLLQVLEEAPA